MARIGSNWKSVAAMLLLSAMAAMAAADAVVTVKGVRVEGDITYEDHDKIVVRTRDYGELHFRKVELSTVVRSSSSAPFTDNRTATPIPPAATGGGAAPPPPPPTGGGFGAPPATGGFGAPPATGAPGDDPFAPPPSGGFGGPPAGTPAVQAAQTERKPVGGALSLVRFARDRGDIVTALAPGGSGRGMENIAGMLSAPETAAPATTTPGIAGNTPSANTPPRDVVERVEKEGGGAVPGLDSITGSRITTAPEIRPGYDAAIFDINPPTVPVRILNPNSSQYEEETQSRLIKENTTIETTVSRAQMQIRQKQDTVRIPEQSRIRIERMSQDAEQVELRVLAGSLWTDVAPRANPSDFKVTTPDLTAGVRGTRFRVEVVPGKGSVVSVDDGEVEVTSLKAPVSAVVTKYQAVMVNVSGQITDILNTDPLESQRSWDQWAQESAASLGGNLAMASAMTPLFQAIATDNAKWEMAMHEAARYRAQDAFQDQMQKVADAFMAFAADTGYVPEDDESWNLMKRNVKNIPGWNGPYLDGPVPPVDPFGQVLVYRRRVPANGNIYATIYSVWEDRQDNGGVPPRDIAVLAPFFQLDVVRQDPRYAPNTTP